MKKIAVLLVTLFFISSVAHAEVGRVKDVFSDGIKFIGGGKIENTSRNELEHLLFNKVISGDIVEYSIYAKNFTYKEFMLKDSSIELKIDQNPTYVLANKKYEIIGPINYKFDAILTVKVPHEIIGKLQLANRVALRFTRNDGSTFVYVLPNEVLAEWKQVINTTE